MIDDPGTVPDDLITPSVAARLARVSPQTLYQWMHRGHIRGWHNGEFRYLVSREEVLRAAFRPVVPRAQGNGVRSQAQEKRAAAEAKERLGKKPGYGRRGRRNREGERI